MPLAAIPFLSTDHGIPMKHSLLILSLFASLCVLLTFSYQHFTRAQAPDVPTFGQAEEEQALDPSEVSFEIPEDADSFEALMEFVQTLGSQRPEFENQQQMMEYQQNLASTVVKVAEKALGMELDEQQLMQSMFLKLQGLQMLADMDDAEARQKLEAAIAEARNHENESIRSVGVKFYVESAFDQWSDWDDQQKSQFVDELVGFIQKPEITIEKLQLMMTVADVLNDMGSEQLAKQMINDLMPSIRSSSNEAIQDSLPEIEGMARRINLPGNEMPLEGALLQGGQLDWESYRGKYVLVDFWASWCGPCRMEVPNVLRLYNAYQDKGFEVVGINLDRTAEEANKYIEELDIPWVNVFSDEEGERGWDAPMAVHYGVTGIPRAILVNPEGKVIDMNARGERLAELLREHLGEPNPRGAEE